MHIPLPKGKYTIQTKAFYRVADNETNYYNYTSGAYDDGTYAYIYAGTGRGEITNIAMIASDETNVTGCATLETDDGMVYIPDSQHGYTLGIDVATGIAVMENGQMTNDELQMTNAGAVYDLSGRKIVNCKSSNCKLPKGLCVINGKTVLVK